MANKKILDNELLTDEQLDEVAGGSWLEFTADMFDAKKRGIAGFHDRKILPQAGVDYRQNAEEPDQFKINGEWRDVWWIVDLANKLETLKFFDSKLGIK